MLLTEEIVLALGSERQEDIGGDQAEARAGLFPKKKVLFLNLHL